MKSVKNIGLFFLLLVVTACAKNNTKSSSTVRLARVGRNYLTVQEAKQSIPKFIFRQDSAKALQNYRDEWINRQLLIQKAKNLNVIDQESIQRKLKHARQQVLTHAVKQIVLAKFEKENSIAKKQALQYFQNHKEQFVLDEKYIRFRHITTDDIKSARTARDELLSNGPWTKVVQKYSQDAKKRIQQSKRYWPVSMVLNDFPTLEQYVVSLDSSEISPVRHLKGAYHFIQLVDIRQKGEYAEPQWVLGRLQKWMMLEKKNQFLKSYIKNLYLEAKEHNEIELYNVSKNND